MNNCIYNTKTISEVPSIVLILIILSTILSCEGKSPANKRASIFSLVEQLANECLQKYQDVPWISLNDFLNRNNQTKWIIVDVRSQIERNVSIIPNAISADKFELNHDQFTSYNILVYCTAGCRSGTYTQLLNKNGFRAFNLKGGVLAWALEGKSFITLKGEKTYQVHVYGKKWNALPSNYKAMW